MWTENRAPPHIVETILTLHTHATYTPRCSHYGTAAAPPPLSALEQNSAVAASAAAEAAMDRLARVGPGSIAGELHPRAEQGKMVSNAVVAAVAMSTVYLGPVAAIASM